MRRSDCKTKGEYRALLDDIRQRGGYFPFPRALAKKVGPLSAVVLLYLVNAAQAGADPEGWQLATESFVAEGIGLLSHRQKIVLAKLQRLGLLTVKVDHHGRRYVRINAETVRGLL